MNRREQETPLQHQPQETADVRTRSPAPYPGSNTSSPLVALQGLEPLSAEQKHSHLSRPDQPDTGAPGSLAPDAELETRSQLVALQEPKQLARQSAQSRGENLLQRHGARFTSSRVIGGARFTWFSASGRHRNPSDGSSDRHLRRFLVFGTIGGSVFLAGLAQQFSLVRQLHMNVIAAYAIQSIVSIETSFLLNRWLTWRDRNASFWRSLWRFNVSKSITVILNFALYQEDKSLVRAGNTLRGNSVTCSLAISRMRLDGHPNIAAANRHHARDPQRTIKLLQAACTGLCHVQFRTASPAPILEAAAASDSFVLTST